MTNPQKTIRAVSPSNLKQAIQFQASITCCILRADGQEEYGVGRTPCYLLMRREEQQHGTMK